MFGSEMIPAGLFALLICFVPETPRYLAMVGQDAKAERILARINGAEEAKKILNDIKNTVTEKKEKLLTYGVLCITGISSDMRDIENAANEGNEKAQLALRMYEYRIKKYIGAYTAAMGGVDAIVFTAGVGENQTDLREEACKNLEYLGIKINKEVNDKVRGEEAIISTDDSKVKVVVVPTDEEIVIARDTMELVSKK